MIKHTILVVDDNQINRMILCEILADQYEILQASTGKEALSLLLNAQSGISAVLLDMIMPGMDGFEVLAAMQEHHLTSRIPVLVTTQQEGTENEVRALSLGAADFLSKPYNPEIIRRRLENLIRFQENAALVNAVERDGLTGLYSQGAFSRLAQERLRQDKDGDFDILMLDLDRFQLVNDLYGVHGGDALLCFMADFLRAEAPAGSLCARISGAHFALLCPRQDGCPERLAGTAADRLKDYPVSMVIMPRVGVYPVEDRLLPIAAMCDRAMLAAGSIKGKYGVYCARYQESMRNNLLEEQRILDDMRSALEQGQFIAYYQPKVDLTTGRIAGAEALVRWKHPTRGLIPPSHFIPLFERNGFITELSAYLWDLVCSDIARWKKDGEVCPISVNVSRIDFYNPRLVATLTSLVKRHVLMPEQLHLEITETAYTQDPSQLIRTVEELKSLGFVIEMDDFGSGYSSLNMLSDLPIDTLKLDMRFLQSAGKKRRNDILPFMVSMAKWLGVHVIAEGVETAEQVSFLHSLGCNCGQGFYFAAPMPPDEYERLMRSGRHWSVGAEPFPGSGIVSLEELWNPMSSFNRIFDGFIGTLVIFEFTGTELRFIRANEKYYGMSSVPFGRRRGAQDLDVLRYTLPADAQRLRSSLMAAAEAGGEFVTDVRWHGEHAADNVSWQHMQFKIIGRSGQVTLFLALMEDITASKNVEHSLLEAAQRDSMTGLLNRVEFENRVRRALASHPDGVAYRGAFLILDVDNFKRINDSCGHQCGDRVICAVSEILRRSVRSEDLTARLGGDEFGIFLCGANDRAIVAARAEELCREVQSYDTSAPFSCSVGVAVCPDNGQQFSELYHVADHALYCAKNQGKNRYVIADVRQEAPA